ncbi:hypothetical protein ADK46_16155 [Streptomyces rimosus subsp. rimosus]|nr:hypothetical protein ADK46_16155 [Streptomyces rimosus subsp. rimosus]
MHQEAGLPWLPPGTPRAVLGKKDFPARFRLADLLDRRDGGAVERGQNDECTRGYENPARPLAEMAVPGRRACGPLPVFLVPYLVQKCRVPTELQAVEDPDLGKRYEVKTRGQ